MSDIFVHDFTYALGEVSRSIEETGADGKLVSKPETLKEAGFHQHRICKPDTTPYDLAKRAVLPLQEKLSKVGAILYATCIPLNGNIGNPQQFEETGDIKYCMDFPASHLQADFGLDHAIVIGLNQQACTGMLGSLRLARSLLLTEPDLEAVLCLTADRFPNGSLYEQSYNLISDGAAACLVSKNSGGYKLLACHGITNGAMARASDDETVGNFFSYTHRIIQEALKKAGLSIGQVDWIVPQNTNLKAWQILSRLLKFDFERVYFRTIGEVGHVISGDNIINLKHLSDEGKVRPGERVLLFMAGYGLNWQCVILEKT